VAPPGEIYASEAMHDQLADDPSFAWPVVGPLDLRSIGSVPVFSLRATAEGAAD
jgi:class 3 adenylate cyclase